MQINNSLVKFKPKLNISFVFSSGVMSDLKIRTEVWLESLTGHSDQVYYLI